MKRKGISIILCCFNSANRIKETLDALGKQENIKNIDCEVILVDNNSSDNTADLAKTYWQPLKKGFELNIIKEQKAGLSHARLAGLKSSIYSYLVYVDDDNSLFPDYISNAHKILEGNPNIGICGGASYFFSKDKITLPLWWEYLKQIYAIGEISQKETYLMKIWGAGMVVRKEAFCKLIQGGFSFLLSDRKGKEVLSGGDWELCFGIQLIGYDVYYSPILKLYHRIEYKRINEVYVNKLYKGFGKSYVYFGIYEKILKGYPDSWLLQLLVCYGGFIYYNIRVIFYRIIFNKEKVFVFKLRRLAIIEQIKELFKLGSKEYTALQKQILALKERKEPLTSSSYQT